MWRGKKVKNETIKNRDYEEGKMAVGINHEGYMETADLQGKTVAEVRGLYQVKFSIPEKAVAVLNGRGIKGKKEAETVVNDCDELEFAVRGGSKLPLLIGALLLALAATGGIFAYTWTTASVTITGATADTEFAAVDANATPPSFGTNVFGKFWGNMPNTGNLFDITPNTNYSGDLLVKVYLTNAASLSKVFQHLNMKLELHDSIAANLNAATTGHTYQLLTLDNGVVTFDLQNGVGAGAPYYVYLAGGSFKSNPRSPLDWSAGYSVAPALYLEVTQR